MNSRLPGSPSARFAQRVQAAATVMRVHCQPVGPRRFQLGGDETDVCALELQRGWLIATRNWAKTELDLLAEHVDWSGPAKIDQNGEAIVRLELPLGDAGDLGASGQFVDEPNLGEADWLPDWLRRIPRWLQGDADPDWTPPAAQQVSDWLTALGHTVAIDAEGGLRTVLKRKGCDGQVQIERREGRLRLAMRLGAWSDLTSTALLAMRRLAQLANHRTRLVRIGWRSADGTHRCEAIVDLTGLPLPDESHPMIAAQWGETLGAAMDGLQLTLDRLGMELDVLANRTNVDAAQASLQPVESHQP